MPAAAFAPAIIGAVGAIGGGIIAGQASKSAAKSAANATRDATAAQIEAQREMFDIQRQDTAPWRYYGEQALGLLGQGFGIQQYSGQTDTPVAANSQGGLITPAGSTSQVQAQAQATGTYNDLQVKDALLNYLAAQSKDTNRVGFAGERAGFDSQFANMSLPDIFSAVGLANDPANIDRLVRINEAARYTDGGYPAAANLYSSTPTDQIPLVGFATPTTAPADTGAAAPAQATSNAPGEFNTPDVFNPGKPDVLLAMDPGYEFRLAEGEKALNRRLAASGISESGRAAKSLLRYGQDYGSQEYGAAYGRLFDTYRSRVADRTDRFNKLATLAGIGQTATAQSNAAAGNAAAGISAAYGQQGSNLASIYSNLGNQQAASYQNIGNAVQGGVNSYLAQQNQQQQNALLQAYLTGGGGGATTGGYSTGAGYFQGGA